MKNIKFNLFSFILVSTVLLIVFSAFYSAENKNEAENYVPNEETAVKVGTAILFPIYGKEINKYTYKAVLAKEDEWLIYATKNGKSIIGGAPCIAIQKSDCKVLRVDRGK
jgi:hypothetical protein